jgi:hypothetical protein
MQYVALAADYDGTIAHDGVVDAPTLAALERLRAGARRLILVTGRELADLRRIMPRLDLFDLVVAENGALLYGPANHEEQALAEPPPPRVVSSSPRGNPTRARCCRPSTTSTRSSDHLQQDCVGVGDAEAALVTSGIRGAGVAELIDGLLATDLAELDAASVLGRVALAADPGGEALLYAPQRESLLVTG